MNGISNLICFFMFHVHFFMLNPDVFSESFQKKSCQLFLDTNIIYLVFDDTAFLRDVEDTTLNFI